MQSTRLKVLASVGGLLVLGFLAAGTDAPEEKSSSSPAGTKSAPGAQKVTPPAPALPMPAVEQQFCDAVRSAASQYAEAKSAGSNELKLSKLRSVRRGAVANAVHGRAAKDWVGTLSHMETTGDGKAALSVTLPCGITVKTWNNGLSDIGDTTLIPQSSPIFDAISDLAKGRAVRFSGRFFSDDVNGFKEVSVTEEGSMTDPEFLLRFSAVAPLQ